MDTQTLVNNVTRVIINPIIALLFAAGLVVFVWGLVEFLWGQSSHGEHGADEGKQHMLWGIIGMFIMAVAFTMLSFIADNACGGLSTCTGGF